MIDILLISGHIGEWTELENRQLRPIIAAAQGHLEIDTTKARLAPRATKVDGCAERRSGRCQ